MNSMVLLLISAVVGICCACELVYYSNVCTYCIYIVNMYCMQVCMMQYHVIIVLNGHYGEPIR